MTRPRLTRDAQKLLETDLDSLEKLEAMRLLRAAPRAISRTELVRETNLDRETMRAAIGELVRSEHLEPLERGELRLGPRAAGQAFDELMQMYDEDRVQVVSALSSIAMERIRGMAVRAFGEALAGKKKSEDDRDR